MWLTPDSHELRRAVTRTFFQRGVSYHHYRKTKDGDSPFLAVTASVDGRQVVVDASYNTPVPSPESEDIEIGSVWGEDHLEKTSLYISRYSISRVGRYPGHYMWIPIDSSYNHTIAKHARRIATAFADAYLYRNNAETCTEAPEKEEQEGTGMDLPDEVCDAEGTCVRMVP